MFGTYGTGAVFLKRVRQELSRGVEVFAYGPAYCAKKDCIGFFGGVERFVCEWGAGGIDGGLEIHQHCVGNVVVWVDVPRREAVR